MARQKSSHTVQLASEKGRHFVENKFIKTDDIAEQMYSSVSCLELV